MSTQLSKKDDEPEQAVDPLKKVNEPQEDLKNAPPEDIPKETNEDPYSLYYPEVPPKYICYRCGLGGHHIRRCRARTAIKRSTGIPRSFMVPVNGPEHRGALLTSSGDYAVPIVQFLCNKEETKEEPSLVTQDSLAPQNEEATLVPQDVQAIKSVTEVEPTYAIQSLQPWVRTGSRRQRRRENKEPPQQEEIPFLGHQDHYQGYDMTFHENGPLIQPQEHNQEYEVPPQEEGPLVRHQENSVPPQEEIPFFGRQEYGVTSQENDSLIQHQENDVPPLVKDAFLQNQELYQQFHIATPGADLLYQQYNVPPYEQNYLLKRQEHYQYPPHQLSMPVASSGQSGLSQPQYMLPASQIFPIQSQPPGTFPNNDSQLPLPPGDELSHPLPTNDGPVFESHLREMEEAVTIEQEKNGSNILEELQRKLNKLYRKYASRQANLSGSRSTEGQALSSLYQSRSSESMARDVSKSPSRTSHSGSPQQDTPRFYSRSRSESRERSNSRLRNHSGTRSRSQSRSRSESEDRHRSSATEKIRSVYPHQKVKYSGSRSRSVSRESSFPRSRYHTGVGSKSQSRPNNESEDRHRSAATEKIRSMYHNQQVRYSGSRSRSGSREGSYPRSRYHTGIGSKSQSRPSNELEDRHQSTATAKIRSLYPDKYSDSRSTSWERSYPKSRYHTGTGSNSSHSRQRNDSEDRHKSSSGDKIRSLDPDEYSRSKFRSVSKDRSYSRSVYHTGTRPKSHSRSRNELEDYNQSFPSEKIHSLDPEQQDTSRLYSGSRSRFSHRYSNSRYPHTRGGSGSYSRQRNESEDGHKSSSPYDRTHSKSFFSQHPPASSQRGNSYSFKHDYSQHYRGPSYLRFGPY